MGEEKENSHQIELKECVGSFSILREHFRLAGKKKKKKVNTFLSSQSGISEMYSISFCSSPILSLTES